MELCVSRRSPLYNCHAIYCVIWKIGSVDFFPFYPPAYLVPASRHPPSGINQEDKFVYAYNAGCLHNTSIFLLEHFQSFEVFAHDLHDSCCLKESFLICPLKESFFSTHDGLACFESIFFDVGSTEIRFYKLCNSQIWSADYSWKLIEIRNIRLRLKPIKMLSIALYMYVTIMSAQVMAWP